MRKISRYSKKTSSLNNLGAMFHTPSKNAVIIHRKDLFIGKLNRNCNLGIFDILKVHKKAVILKAVICLYCRVCLSTQLYERMISDYPEIDIFLTD